MTKPNLPESSPRRLSPGEAKRALHLVPKAYPITEQVARLLEEGDALPGAILLRPEGYPGPATHFGRADLWIKAMLAGSPVCDGWEIVGRERPGRANSQETA